MIGGKHHAQDSNPNNRTEKTHTHNLHSGSAKNILGTVSLEDCHSDLQGGRSVVASQNRSDQGHPFADPKYRSMFGGNHPNDTTVSGINW